MFQNTPAFASFSVDDLEKAKHFYGQVLQLAVTEDPAMHLLQINLSGGANLMIYPKPNHTPATFTVLNFPVKHIEEAVTALKKRDVTFESYDQEHLRTDGNNIARSAQVAVAWFKDPAGNILSVLEVKKDASS